MNFQIFKMCCHDKTELQNDSHFNFDLILRHWTKLYHMNHKTIILPEITFKSVEQECQIEKWIQNRLY